MPPTLRLARPLVISDNKAALARPELAAFVRFYVENAEALTLSSIG
jgi:hypothetical protein